MPARKTTTSASRKPRRGAGAWGAGAASGRGAATAAGGSWGAAGAVAAAFSGPAALGASAAFPAGISEAWTLIVRVVGGKQLPPAPSVQAWYCTSRATSPLRPLPVTGMRMVPW